MKKLKLFFQNTKIKNHGNNQNTKIKNHENNQNHCQLPTDCLNEILEWLKQDGVTLRSCLLVNHLWCEMSVPILWTKVRNYNTLISCLSNESKQVLFKKVVTSKPPTFDYMTFIKHLSIHEIHYKTECVFKDFDDDQTVLATREIV